MVAVGFEDLPISLLNEIIVKLDSDTEALCSLACVSRPLRFAVYEALSLSSSLHLSVRLNFPPFFSCFLFLFLGHFLLT